MELTLLPAQTKEFLGLRFADCDMSQALEWIERGARQEFFSYLVTPNVDHVVTYWTEGTDAWRPSFRHALQGADLCLNDSRILQRLSRLSGENLRVTPGSDIVSLLVAGRKEAKGALALVGGTGREAAWLRAALPAHTVHHMQPPMGVRDDPEVQRRIADFIERCRADIVLLAIGAPQSELVAHEVARRGAARGVALCIGASVEFLSGAKRRAPRWLQQMGLEWLYRLICEPKRLWRRYVLDGPRIVGLWRRHRTRT